MRTADMQIMTKRQAIRHARACADAVIEQRQRWANGWDKGAFRDDDQNRYFTARRIMQMNVNHAFRLSAMFANK